MTPKSVEISRRRKTYTQGRKTNRKTKLMFKNKQRKKNKTFHFLNERIEWSFSLEYVIEKSEIRRKEDESIEKHSLRNQLIGNLCTHNKQYIIII